MSKICLYLQWANFGSLESRGGYNELYGNYRMTTPLYNRKIETNFLQTGTPLKKIGPQISHSKASTIVSPRTLRGQQVRLTDILEKQNPKRNRILAQTMAQSNPLSDRNLIQKLNPRVLDLSSLSFPTVSLRNRFQKEHPLAREVFIPRFSSQQLLPGEPLSASTKRSGPVPYRSSGRPYISRNIERTSRYTGRPAAERYRERSFGYRGLARKERYRPVDQTGARRTSRYRDTGRTARYRGIARAGRYKGAISVDNYRDARAPMIDIYRGFQGEDRRSKWTSRRQHRLRQPYHILQGKPPSFLRSGFGDFAKAVSKQIPTGRYRPFVY